jgi:hypothetical protein
LFGVKRKEAKFFRKVRNGKINKNYVPICLEKNQKIPSS